MPRTVTLRLNDDVYQILREVSLAENRPLSNLIETAALAKILEQEFADDAEMAEIRANSELLQRMKTGSSQALAGRGRFVD